jgi:hypothetical protein
MATQNVITEEIAGYFDNPGLAVLEFDPAQYFTCRDLMIDCEISESTAKRILLYGVEVGLLVKHNALGKKLNYYRRTGYNKSDDGNESQAVLFAMDYDKYKASFKPRKDDGWLNVVEYAVANGCSASQAGHTLSTLYRFGLFERIIYDKTMYYREIEKSS